MLPITLVSLVIALMSVKYRYIAYLLLVCFSFKLLVNFNKLYSY